MARGILLLFGMTSVFAHSKLNICTKTKTRTKRFRNQNTQGVTEMKGKKASQDCPGIGKLTSGQKIFLPGCELSYVKIKL